MKKSLVTACLSVIIFTSLVSCKRTTVVGSGDIGTEKREVGSFSGVDIAAKIKADIYIDSTAEPSVKLEGYENVLEKIKTHISNNILHIDTKERFWLRSDRDIKAVITVPSLSLLDVSGTGDVDVKGYNRTNSLDINITGAGNVVIEHVSVKKLAANLTGIGDLKIKEGHTNFAAVTISGAGEVDAEEFICKQAKVKVSGIGDVSIHAEEKLDAIISGAGDISYKGHPVITKHITGVGDIDEHN